MNIPVAIIYIIICIILWTVFYNFTIKTYVYLPRRISKVTVGSIVASAILTAAIIYLWWLAALMIVAGGIFLSSKAPNVGTKAIIITVSIIMGIIIALSFRNFKSDSENNNDQYYNEYDYTNNEYDVATQYESENQNTNSKFLLERTVTVIKVLLSLIGLIIVYYLFKGFKDFKNIFKDNDEQPIVQKEEKSYDNISQKHATESVDITTQYVTTTYIESPFSGTIFQINTKNGDLIKKGDTLLTIYYSDLERPIKAPCDGKVKEVLIEQYKMVNLGDILIEIYT